MERLVQVSDQEVRLNFELGCKCRANVRLTSLSATTPIAFKVQTSSPHKFLVSPPNGLILPLSYTTFQIILKPQIQLPTSFPRSPSDRFLIKTALAPEFSLDSTDSTHSNSVNSWFTTRPQIETYDVKLKVSYVGLFLLQHAVSKGNIEVVKNIIKRQKPILSELPPQEAESLLRVANESSNSDAMIKFLLESGLKSEVRLKLDNVNTGRNSRWVPNGWTEIHAAASLDLTEKLQRLIIETRNGGGTLDCKDKEGQTPLHLAAGKGNMICAKMLIEAGADKNAKSNDGRTALYRAAENGESQMVAMLMEMGADPTLSTTPRGLSPLHVAQEKGHKEVVEILEQGDLVLYAARKGELRQLEMLLKQGARLSYHDQYGLNALHLAAIKGLKEAVSMLVEFGIDLECLDNEGHTPLHLAVEGGDMETVELLVNKGANVNTKSNRGATPLYIARALGHDDISELLLKSGAASSSLSSSTSTFSPM